MATTVQDIDGWLPLHIALRCCAPSGVITMILQAYPKAAEVQDKKDTYRCI
jgi:hypothetical protein